MGFETFVPVWMLCNEGHWVSVSVTLQGLSMQIETIMILSYCRLLRSGLELIASKWAHSLTEFDLAWANVQEPLDNAIKAIAEKGAESPLK